MRKSVLFVTLLLAALSLTACNVTITKTTEEPKTILTPSPTVAPSEEPTEEPTVEPTEEVDWRFAGLSLKDLKLYGAVNKEVMIHVSDTGAMIYENLPVQTLLYTVEFPMQLSEEERLYAQENLYSICLDVDRSEDLVIPIAEGREMIFFYDEAYDYFYYSDEMSSIDNRRGEDEGPMGAPDTDTTYMIGIWRLGGEEGTAYIDITDPNTYTAYYASGAVESEGFIIQIDDEGYVFELYDGDAYFTTIYFINKAMFMAGTPNDGPIYYVDRTFG